MRPLVLRLSRILIVALIASLAISGSAARGYGWLGASIALAIFGAYWALTLRRRPWSARLRREARWEAALFQAPQRPRAIAELRRALARLEPVSERTRGEHTRLSVLLAELLDADRRYPEASAVVDALPLATLSSLEAALVRHTSAVTHLRASDPQGALRALVGRAPSGDQELDQRLELLERYAGLELGEVQPALTYAGELETAPGIDESVVLEARVVRAAALDALGRREEALVALAALGRASLIPLADLGQPRVRALAAQVLETYQT